MPRRNNRDRRFTELKEYTNQNSEYYENVGDDKKKPIRRRKGQWDKKIYKEEND